MHAVGAENGNGNDGNAAAACGRCFCSVLLCYLVVAWHGLVVESVRSMANGGRMVYIVGQDRWRGMVMA